MRIHLPHAEYKHYAFVIDEIELTKIGDIEYAGSSRACEFLNIVDAGVYGFTNKEDCIKFVNKLNRAGESEIAFVASVATEAVAP